tara:strand:- start:309 stop:512 length:204 start_codon:yes stop_codon:yes gene_type:complete
MKIILILATLLFFQVGCAELIAFTVGAASNVVAGYIMEDEEEHCKYILAVEGGKVVLKKEVPCDQPQ